jgi:hypothetical protein
VRDVACIPHLRRVARIAEGHGVRAVAPAVEPTRRPVSRPRRRRLRINDA